MRMRREVEHGRKHISRSGTVLTRSSLSPLATCFFLGMLFAGFPYDFPLLWSKVTPDEGFFEMLEVHLRFLFASPPLISRMLNIMVFVAFAGMLIKLFRPSEANFLFDGASLILYVIAVAVYTSNIVKGLRTVSSDLWDTDEFRETRTTEVEGEFILGRQDSLRVMAASNTILALILIGVLVLQAGQWYAEKRDDPETEDEAEAKPASAPSKKKKAASPTTKKSKKNQ